MIPEFTTVCGVDAYHLKQLRLTFPTWRKNKPSLLDRPMIVFRDVDQVGYDEVVEAVDHPNLRIFSWPMGEVDYGSGGNGKWDDPQRCKMLSGFVYVPAMYVRTPYWLKLDTDMVATEMDDWILPEWFKGEPAIVSHRWSFTKPGDQMLALDRWVREFHELLPEELTSKPELKLAPEPGSERLGHRRIISWCGFFRTGFTRRATKMAENTVGPWRMPVPSQDGFLWYVAKRMGLGIERVFMKSRGWQNWSTWNNVEKYSREAMIEETR